MGNYAYRVVNSLLGSEMLPASLRMRVMRGLGFDISKQSCIWAGASFRSKKVTIGSNVFINVGFFHDGDEHLEIGDNVRIGQYVRVLTATHDIGPPQQRGRVEVIGKRVRIEDGCWVCSGVTILPGVTIARGCVIAASSTVIHSTTPNGLYAGHPAKRIRDL